MMMRGYRGIISLLFLTIFYSAIRANAADENIKTQGESTLAVGLNEGAAIQQEAQARRDEALRLQKASTLADLMLRHIMDINDIYNIFLTRTRIVKNEDALDSAYFIGDHTDNPHVEMSIEGTCEYRSNSELAAALGHELAHAVFDHRWKTMELLVKINKEGGDESVAYELARRQELEADYWGAVYAQRAGYKPEDGIQYFSRRPDWDAQQEKILKTNPENVRTHPPFKTRIAELEKSLPQIKKLTPVSSPQNWLAAIQSLICGKN